MRLSLELHLFFDRIMKEHSFFLEASFTDKNKEFKNIAHEFQNEFSKILENIVNLANNNLSQDFLQANELVTKNTLEAESKSSELTTIPINTNITKKELNLQSGNININPLLVNNINSLNTKTLNLVRNLIHFKKDVLNQVLTCKSYTTNYPLLITHIMNEAKMYYDLLLKVQKQEQFSPNYLKEQELFWNNIMKEHAVFIRGLLNPSENKLIMSANNFANDYNNILKKYLNNPTTLTNISLQETISFRDFKIAGEEGILNCQIKSIIIPLLADHVLREANHFIRILRR
ncbi:MAG: DUF2935 domain-containing protein [Bacilli bacterium]